MPKRVNKEIGMKRCVKCNYRSSIFPEKIINKKAVNFQTIEKKWQNQWEKKKIFEVRVKKGKKKFYVLEMFPYPSAYGIHMGHARNYTLGDMVTRFRRMQGYNVLYAMGYDSFGLPAENAAIQEKVHPKKFTEKAIVNIIKQQKSLGLSYDWTRIIATSYPEYYKWNQYLFLKFYEKGLAYRKKAPVNFCPKCKTVLANEQVVNGKCWRHSTTDVQIKHLEQWFLKITDYSDELLEDIEKLDWPERIKIMQKNWIGKSKGTEINFNVDGKIWPVFTTRSDTIYGVTFMVISAQHPKLFEFVKGTEQEKEVIKFAQKVRTIKQQDLDKMEKEGVFTGKYAVNPINNKKVPVYVGNFVLAEYGSGMVMAVPAHDQRDFEFAKKYKLPIRVVIQPKKRKLNEKTMRQAYVDYGILINSGKFDKMESERAIKEISKHLEKTKAGKRTTEYKIKDWLISRQRYWGTPIPIIYCKKCGIVPVLEKDLPVKLPEKVKFGKGNPLESSKNFINVKCPKCKSLAKRETDTMDTFFDSSWYFLRYCDSKNKNKIFDKEKIKYWMSVDQYIGGSEHAVGHLIYSRFFTKVFRDLGFLKINEPFMKLINQGIVTKGGLKMSKSLGNVIDPTDIIEDYGADTLRVFLLFMAAPESQLEWDDSGIDAMRKFLKKIYNLKTKFKETNKRLEHFRNKAIKEVTEDIENFRFNLALIKLMKWLDLLYKESDKKSYEDFLKMISIFAPHIAEELWHNLRHKTFISLEIWPKANEKKIDKKIEKQQEHQEKLKEDIRNIVKIIDKKPKSIFIYVIPKEIEIYEEVVNDIKNEFSCDVRLFALNDKDIYDPQNKSKKAKPGKPAIYIE